MPPLLAELPPSFGYVLIGVILIGLCLFLALCFLPGLAFASLFEEGFRKSGVPLSWNESWFSASLICAEFLGPLFVTSAVGLVQAFLIFYGTLSLIWICILYKRHRFSRNQLMVLAVPFLSVMFCVELIAFASFAFALLK